MRNELGDLFSLRVAPSTEKRYFRAITLFLWFCMWAYPKGPDTLDELEVMLCAYLNALWLEGEQKCLGADALSGVTHVLMKRRICSGAWHMLKTWSARESGRRATPLPHQWALGVAGWLFAQGHVGLGLSLLLAFHCFLRTGEWFQLSAPMVMVDQRGCGVVALPWSKSGQRTGASEIVTIDDSLIGCGLLRWLLSRPANPLLCAMHPLAARELLRRAFDALGLASFNFLPYSIRRGGATYDFTQHHDLSRTLFRGRWSQLKVAKIYITDGAAALTAMHLPAGTEVVMSHYQQVCCTTLLHWQQELRKAGRFVD